MSQQPDNDDGTLVGLQPLLPQLHLGDQPTLLDPATAKAVRALLWTITYLLWLAAAVAALFLVMVIVAAVNGSIPG